MTWPTISRDPERQAHYEAMRSAGESHNIASLLALQVAPHLLTDSVFLAGLSTNGSQFEGAEQVGDHYKAIAAEAGVDVKGKVYVSGLATYPGDPKAWISGRGDVERVCRERGFSASGAVNVKAADIGPPPEDVDVADDIVARAAQERMEADPLLSSRPRDEVLHETKQQLLPSWAK